MWLTIPEAARELRLSPSTVLRYVRQGLLPASKVGRRYLIDRSDLEAFVAQRRVQRRSPGTPTTGGGS